MIDAVACWITEATHSIATTDGLLKMTKNKYIIIMSYFLRHLMPCVLTKSYWMLMDLIV